MDIALIGATGTRLDITCLTDIYAALGILSGQRPNLDLIDLRRGRDFLREDKVYDVVALLYIFRCRPEELIDDVLAPVMLRLDPDTYRVSSLHTPENWRARLLRANPQHIFVFGGNPKSEVTHDYLGDLPGFEHREVSDMTHYRRVACLTRSVPPSPSLCHGTEQ